ncbi:MAG TPA: ABC transporter permease [Candidatus Polarisedimenticolaceae bacterium]|nr:ABC transporter permease [Candidatus Polarisedimenticolaceae bacterium]
MRLLKKLWAFLVRDFLSDVSYRFAFVLQLGGMLFAVCGFYFFSKMVNPATEGLDGIEPFPWLLVGVAFQIYFSTALSAFSDKVRSEQVLGTLEAMLVSPTPTSVVIFSSTAYEFTWGALRLVIYLLSAVFIFGVHLDVKSPLALACGIVLTLLSSAGIGMLSASFILYFKRGDPVNFILSMGTMFFGNVFFPSKLLPDSVRAISAWLPMSWSLKVVRGALLKGASFSEVSGELGRLAVLTAILVPLGLFGARIAIRRAKREGSLVQY